MRAAVGDGMLALTQNNEGSVSTPAPAAITYEVDPDGTLRLLAGSHLEGGVGAGGRFAVLAGGTLSGESVSFALLLR